MPLKLDEIEINNLSMEDLVKKYDGLNDVNIIHDKPEWVSSMEFMEDSHFAGH